MNRTQATSDPDGMLRFVISHKDPGIENGLATAGAYHGYVMIRWEGIRTPLGAADQPRAIRARLAEVGAHLPPGTVRLTP